MNNMETKRRGNLGHHGVGTAVIGLMIAGPAAGMNWGSAIGFFTFGAGLVVVGVCERLADREIRL